MAPRMKGGGSTRTLLAAHFWLQCLLLWGQCWAYHCNDKYRKFSPRHTICLPHREDCSIASTGVTKKEVREIMDAHNKYRQYVATGRVPGYPPAANMMELVWDNELAAVAQAHAKQCRFHHDCYSCRRVSRFSAGQNMFLHYSSSLRLKPTNWASVVKSWFDEYKLFDPNEIDSFRTIQDSGHFTQLIWAKTTHVGCGKARFKIKEEDWYRTLYTCNYGPIVLEARELDLFCRVFVFHNRGNVVQSRVYEKGQPCSRCPNGTSCSRSMPGLCRIAAMPLARLSPANVVRIYHFPQQRLSPIDVVRIHNFPQHRLSPADAVRIHNFPQQRLSPADVVRIYHFPQQQRMFHPLPEGSPPTLPPMPLRAVQAEPMQRIQQAQLPLNPEALQRVSRKVDMKPQEPSTAVNAENSSCKCDEAAIERMRKKLFSIIPKTRGVVPEIQVRCQCNKSVSPGSTYQVLQRQVSRN